MTVRGAGARVRNDRLALGSHRLGVRFVNSEASGAQAADGAAPAAALVRALSKSDEARLRVAIIPYVIALSKLDRGFDTLIDDVVFLLDRGLVTFDRRREEVERAVARAADFRHRPRCRRRPLGRRV